MKKNWIDATIEVPSDESAVLTFVAEDGTMHIAYYNQSAEMFFDDDGVPHAVTHWIYLPKPPRVNPYLGMTKSEAAAHVILKAVFGSK